MKRYGLRKAIEALSNKIDEHIGSNGDKAHLPADIDRAGFVTPVQVKTLHESIGNRTLLPEQTDITTLGPGRYAGHNLVGIARTGWLMVDVSEYTNDMKQIYVLDSALGIITTKTIHKDASGTNVAAPEGWTYTHRYISLWDGSVSDVGQEATLGESSNKFGTFRIGYRNPSNKLSWVIKEKADCVINDLNVFSSEAAFSVYKTSITFSADGKTASITDSRAFDVTQGGNITDSANHLKIVKIEGIK